MATEYNYRKFNTLAEFSSYLDNGKTQPRYAGRESSQRVTYSNWYGTDSFEQAQELMKYGDAEAAKLIGTEVAKLRASINVKRSQIRTEAAVVGFMPHVPNFIQGVPLSMIAARREDVQRKAVTIIYNISANSGVGAEELHEASLRLLCAVVRIEAEGRRVELYTGDTAEAYIRGKYVSWGFFVRLKSSDTALNVVKCTYPLTNPSFLRRHSFRYSEVTPGTPAGYGAAVSNLKDVQQAASSAGVPRGAVISYYDIAGLTTEGILKLIEKRLQDIK